MEEALETEESEKEEVLAVQTAGVEGFSLRGSLFFLKLLHLLSQAILPGRG